MGWRWSLQELRRTIGPGIASSQLVLYLCASAAKCTSALKALPVPQSWAKNRFYVIIQLRKSPKRRAQEQDVLPNTYDVFHTPHCLPSHINMFFICKRRRSVRASMQSSFIKIAGYAYSASDALYVFIVNAGSFTFLNNTDDIVQCLNRLLNRYKFLGSTVPESYCPT